MAVGLGVYYMGRITKQQEIEKAKFLEIAYSDFAKGLNKHSFYKVPNRAISEDLVQTTFLKTWNYLLRGGKVDLMKAFLYKILNNLIVDEYRKAKAVSLDGLLEKGFQPSTDETTRLFNFLDGKAAMLLINRLPATYRKVFRLRYVHGLSLDEISSITGKTKNTVAVQIHRGLKKIKVLYNEKKLLRR